MSSTCKELILWGNCLVPSTFRRKKVWLSIRRCPLHANPEELVLEVIAAFWVSQGPCTGYTNFHQHSLGGIQFGSQLCRQICRSVTSICHHKNLVSFESRVASTKQPSMAKQQRLVVSIIALLNPFRSHHFRWVEVSCAKCSIGWPCSLHTHAGHALSENGFNSSKAIIQHRNLAHSGTCLASEWRMLKVHNGPLFTCGIDVGITQSRLSAKVGFRCSWPHGACDMTWVLFKKSGRGSYLRDCKYLLTYVVSSSYEMAPTQCLALAKRLTS